MYGNANPALTFTVGGQGLVNGDTLTGALGTMAGLTSGVGTYAITQGTLAASSNYALTYTGANLSVTARPLTVTADALSRIYGNANPALTYTVGGDGLVNGDTLTGALATTTGLTSSVGSYAITQGSLAASSNYALTYVGNNLTVTARPITVTADALSRIYGNANPALTYTVGGQGLVNGDTLTGALATTAGLTSNVGSYAITQGSLAAGSNYALTYAGANLTVTARPLTITADALSRIYGNANPALTFTVGGQGLVNGDTLTGALATTAGLTSNVGSYAITQGSLAAGSNYELTYTGANLTVTARPLTVTADALTRIYGNANPALTYTVGGQGLVNGDTLTGALATTAGLTSNVGSYVITQGSLAASSNYALAYVGNNLTVTARPLTVTADALSRIYGNANPALTFTVGGQGLVNGDTLTGALATAAGLTSNVGSYAITQGSLAAGSNYALTYAGANLTVTARPLTITADALSRIYGNANPALTYTVGGDGLVNGDTLSGALATAAGLTSNVGSYAITQGSLAAGSNYALTYTGANLTVTARPITVTADALTRIYGNANPALTFTVGGQGLVNGDTLTGALATTAGLTSNVGSYAITQGSLAAGSNYALTYTGANLTVTARPITVSADALTRIYGNANPALTYTVGGQGLVNGDTLTGALATTTGLTSSVGSYAITQGSLAASSNYALTYVGNNLTVTARPITVTADALSRIYGNANPALTYTVGGQGLVNGDTLTGALATTAGLTSNVGSYAITQGSLAAGSNYALTYAGANLTVTARPLTITADALSRIYGDANPALTYTVGGQGLVNGDTLTGALATGAGLTSNVGSYAITQGTLAASSNYALTYVGNNLAVTARPITVTADALSRIYGNANPALTYTVGGQGLVNGDTLTGALATTAGLASNVGTYAITQSSLAAGSNYALTYTGGNLTVTARPITVTADALTRIYGNANPALTYTVGGQGLVNGDTLTGALATTAGLTSNVGSYAITQGSLAASSNYALTYVGNNLTVTARPLTVTADALTRIYGNANPALTFTVGGQGLVNGDTLTGALATTAGLTSNVGTYTITQGSLAASSNYALTYTGANLSVTARPLTVTADALSRIYGNANPALTFTVGGQGLVNGDTLTGALATTAGLTSNVGSYAITQGSLAASSNYALTYVGNNLAVTARPLTVTADALSRIYGNANPALTFTVGGQGLVNGDTVTGALGTMAGLTSGVGTYAITQGTLAASSNYALTYTGANLSVTARPLTVTADALSRIYGNANPALTYTVGGQGLVNGDTLTGALATAAGLTSNVGSYAITQGSLAASSNYALTYTGADLTVTARPITITADALTRIYGNANPALTYTVGGQGLVNGDTLIGALATTAGLTSNVGTYAITQGTLAAGSNYELTYTGANLTVTARPLTVTADALSRIYGNANPALTYTVGGQGLVNGDTLTGALATTAGLTSNVGSYAITQGTLAAGSNYALTYTGANLTVTARPLTITADALTRIYGDANPALTYTVGGDGLVNGDTLSGALATAAGLTSNIGSYAITQGSLAAGSNYALTYTGANLTVTARPITVTADALSRIYGNANPALTFTVGGQGLVNGDTLTGALATTAGLTSNVGSYVITQGSLAASSNYALAYVGNNLTVTARPLTVTADALSRIYGNANPALTFTVGGQGLVNGDTLSGALATTAGLTSNVGSYAITQGSLAASSNYTLTGFTGADLTVTARPITVTADALTRIYGNANPALTYTVGGQGLVNGDALTGALAATAGLTSNVGSYAITQGTLAAGSNYALTYAGANLTVTARPLTITADALSRIYGNANPALTYTVGGDGLVNGDTLSGALATAAGLTSNVGSYAITQGSLAAGSNYALTYTGANLTVTARPITVTADALTRIYGNANPALTYTVGGQGLVNGDTLTGALATTAGLTSNVGSYAITQGSLAAGSNYELTYTGANLTVTARPLTVTADALSRIYGNANPALTFTVGGHGLVNGDTLSGALATTAALTSNVGTYAITQGSLAASSNYALTYTGANLTITARPLTITADALSRIYGNGNHALTFRVGGQGLVNGDTLTGALATTAGLTSNVGSYAITQGSLAAGSNYTLTYAGANLTVTARPLTVTADALTRIYGNVNPALTYTVGGQGLVNGDTLTGALATTAGLTSNVGTYTITQGSLAASSNYALTYTGANLTVTARPLTITADALTRIYGNANPALTYTVGGQGLVNGDTLTGALATGAGVTSNTGTYAITRGTLSASSNYALTYNGANLTITPRPITVTAESLSKALGALDPALTYAVGGLGLVNGDSLAGALARDAGEDAGSYMIRQGTLANFNYAIQFVPGTLTINPAVRSPNQSVPPGLGLSGVDAASNSVGNLLGNPLSNPGGGTQTNGSGSASDPSGSGDPMIFAMPGGAADPASGSGTAPGDNPIINTANQGCLVSAGGVCLATGN
ncbi:MBG domain-containing protein [Blastomonas sp. SL216]|uniref:MBG domain-containing protein n=1 Tax=Blastomonas sp. SL216 TaxID=2995169 RepID=UPI0023779B43|nr:MBG domain-containing protein [Blastomonas sp. SL216]